MKDVVAHNFSIRKTCKKHGLVKSTLCRYVKQAGDGNTFDVAKKSCTTNQICHCLCPCFTLIVYFSRPLVFDHTHYSLCSKLFFAKWNTNCVCIFFQIFTDSEEKQLCEYLLSCAILLCTLGKIQARQVAYQFAVYLHKKIPPTWENNKLAGEDCEIRH